MEKFFFWLTGYLYISFQGPQTVRFLNLCRNHGIMLSKLEMGRARICVRDFRKLQGIARKTRTRIHIEEKRGGCFLIQRILGHFSIVAAVLLFCGTLFLCSLFVWDISVEGGKKYTQEWMLSYLQTQGIETGCLKSKVDCERIEQKIREDFRDIGWVSVALSGTCIRVSIVETQMPELYQPSLEASHLIAGHDGMVSYIMTRSGTPKVKLKQQVKKGDVLVEGMLRLYGEEGTVTECQGICADADIFIDFVKKYQNTFSLKKKVRVYTGREKEQIGLSFAGKSIFFPFFSDPYEKKEVTEQETKLYLTKTFCLPVRFREKKEKEYEERWEKMSRGEAEAEAKRQLQEYFAKLEKKGVSILENRVTIEVVESECRMSGQLLLRENVTGRRKVSKEELLSEIGTLKENGTE